MRGKITGHRFDADAPASTCQVILSGLSNEGVCGRPESEHRNTNWGYSPEPEPNLGLATTRELLQELKVRGEVNRMEQGSLRRERDWIHIEHDADHLLGCVSADVLDYKTVSR